MKRDEWDYRGWRIFFQRAYLDEHYAAFNKERYYSCAWFFAKTSKELKAKIKRHIERWGW